MTKDTASDDSSRILAIRVAIGLAQGLALYLLFNAFQEKAWLATEGPLYAALCTAAFFVPLIAVSALTELRSRKERLA